MALGDRAQITNLRQEDFLGLWVFGDTVSPRTIRIQLLMIALAKERLAPTPRIASTLQFPSASFPSISALGKDLIVE